jgi:hypothetical protein
MNERGSVDLRDRSTPELLARYDGMAVEIISLQAGCRTGKKQPDMQSSKTEPGTAYIACSNRRRWYLGRMAEFSLLSGALARGAGIVVALFDFQHKVNPL